MDREQLTEWFGRWRKPIRSWLRNFASVPRGEVDDLAQEVFVRLMRYSDDAVIDNPQAYLFRIAANVAHERRKRCRVSKEHDSSWLDDLLTDGADEPEQAMEREQTDARVRTAIQRLPRRQREVLLMHVNEELTYRQIAELRGVTCRLVLRDLTKAYKTLRMKL